MARLLADEDFSMRVVEELRSLGHDVIRVQEVGLGDIGTSDDDVLKFATDQARCLLTFNRWDFIRLHQLNQAHAGIIVCTRDKDAKGQAGRIDQSIVAQASLAGLLIRVNRPV